MTADSFSSRDDGPVRRVSFGKALRFWVKLGWISFGGPAGQIAIMHRELVERRRWLSDGRFLHALNFCMLLPGPEAQQLAIYIGWLMHRVPGGIAAGAFFVIPSIAILLLLSWIYAAYGNVPLVAGLLAGFKPVVVAIVVEAVVRIGKKALKRRSHLLLAGASFTAIYFLKVPFPVIVLAAGLIGAISTRLWPPAPDAVAATATTSINRRPPALRLVIDDDVPPPAHTLPSRQRALAILATGLLAWSVPLLVLVWLRGTGDLHGRQYLFFTKAALVTFGGAYAVLAYVIQAATDFGWVTRAQTIDGLALAETTPGPLIMVLQFVGFMTGWNHPGNLGQVNSAVIGALVTTYATFLPCFVFIFLGAPYVESLRGNRTLTGALSGITAAVVGVILNLAVVFGATVIFPRGLTGGIDGFSAGLTVAAFFALFRLKISVPWVVLAGGALGLAWTML